MIEYIIDEEYESVRVDRFLRKHLKNINLSEIYKMLRKGKIKVNNKKISQDYRLVLGDIVFIFLPENFKENQKEDFIELSQERREKLKEMIVFENENLFVINKSLGDVVHKGSGHDISLLEEFRSYYLKILYQVFFLTQWQFLIELCSNQFLKHQVLDLKKYLFYPFDKLLTKIYMK